MNEFLEWFNSILKCYLPWPIKVYFRVVRVSSDVLVQFTVSVAKEEELSYRGQWIIA